MGEEIRIVTHLADEYEQTYKTLIPYIPKSTMEGEDKTQKRICVSDTVEGCIQAHSRIWYNAFGYAEWENMDPFYDMSQKVVLIDHDEIGGLLVRAYEFHLPVHQLVLPETLYEKEWVPDALETREHWITKETKPERTYYVLITSGELRRGEKPTFSYRIFEEHEIGTIENMLDYHFRKEKEKEEHYQKYRGEKLECGCVRGVSMCEEGMRLQKDYIEYDYVNGNMEEYEKREKKYEEHIPMIS